MAGPDDYVEMSATYFIESVSKTTKKMEQKGLAFLSPVEKTEYWHLWRACYDAEKSHKFVFGNRKKFDGDDAWDDTENLAATAAEFYYHGVSIVPYPCCWFEWDSPAGSCGVNGMLEKPAKQICIIRELEDLITFEIYVNERGVDRASLSDGWISVSYVLSLGRDCLDDGPEYKLGHYACLPSNTTHLPFEHLSAGHGFLTVRRCLAAMALLLSRETRTIERHPPASLNAHRVKKGKVPFFSHHVVTIDQQRVVYEGGDGSQFGGPKRTSPRLHWRRGHVRTLSSGKKIGIPPSIIGAKNGGGGPVIDKTYRVRMDHDTRSVATGTAADSAGDEAGVPAG